MMQLSLKKGDKTVLTLGTFTIVEDSGHVIHVPPKAVEMCRMWMKKMRYSAEEMDLNYLRRLNATFVESWMSNFFAFLENFWIAYDWHVVPKWLAEFVISCAMRMPARYRGIGENEFVQKSVTIGDGASRVQVMAFGWVKDQERFSVDMPTVFFVSGDLDDEVWRSGGKKNGISIRAYPNQHQNHNRTG